MLYGQACGWHHMHQQLISAQNIKFLYISIRSLYTARGAVRLDVGQSMGSQRILNCTSNMLCEFTISEPHHLEVENQHTNSIQLALEMSASSKACEKCYSSDLSGTIYSQHKATTPPTDTTSMAELWLSMQTRQQVK